MTAAPLRSTCARNLQRMGRDAPLLGAGFDVVGRPLCRVVLADASEPNENIGISDDEANHATHTLIYGMLAWLVWRPLAARGGQLPALVIAFPELVAFLYAVFYAIGDEIHQAFVSGRTASVWDVLADVIGELAAIAPVWVVRSRHEAAQYRA